MNKPQLILALDVDTLDEAKRLVEQLSGVVSIFKVGSQMFTLYGPSMIRFLQEHGKKVFLDLKFHDIPHTVASAVKSATALHVHMLTVHTQGGKDMLKAAVEAACQQAKVLNVDRPLIFGVTVLTSAPQESNTQDIVLERAHLAQCCGLDGVVASVEEAAVIRRSLGENFLIVTPGIRPTDASLDDQKRTATPTAAIEQGSNFLVVGRPILKASHPQEAALKILREIEK